MILAVKASAASIWPFVYRFSRRRLHNLISDRSIIILHRRFHLLTSLCLVIKSGNHGNRRKNWSHFLLWLWQMLFCRIRFMFCWKVLTAGLPKGDYSAITKEIVGVASACLNHGDYSGDFCGERRHIDRWGYRRCWKLWSLGQLESPKCCHAVPFRRWRLYLDCNSQCAERSGRHVQIF